MTYYKVVKEENGRFFSCIARNAEVEYKIGEWVKSLTGPLFVFDDLKEARSFTGEGELVFECEVVRPRKPTIILHECQISTNFCFFFWKNISRYTVNSIGFVRPIDNTIICDEVYLWG